MDPEEIVYLQRLLKTHTERVRILELRSASFGVNCPAEITLEIEDINSKIASLKQRLGRHINSLPDTQNSSDQLLRGSSSLKLRSFSFLIVIISIFLGFLLGLAAVAWLRAPDKGSVAEGAIPTATRTLIPIEDEAVFPIEKGHVTAFLYQGTENPKIGQGTAKLGVTSSIVDGNFSTSYKLDYNLPKDGEGYAGVALWFPEPLDVSEYGFIELTVSFEDEQARCRLFLKDSFGAAESVILGDGNFASAKLQEQTIQIPLKTFSSIAKKSLREIDLDVNNFFVQERHSFTISNIQFRK